LDGSLPVVGNRCGIGFAFSGGIVPTFGIGEEAAPPITSGLRAISDGIGIVVVVMRRAGASGLAGAAAAGNAALYDACCTA
jgi:hypothetical protein